MSGILTEIWGEPGSGKSHLAIEGWPNPLVLDTAFTNMGFRTAEVKDTGDERGETWPILLKLYDYDEEEASRRYKFLDEFPDSFEFAEGFDTVIIDNAADLRVLAVRAWCEENDQDWPQQGQWGAVNDKIDWFLQRLRANHHVVVVSQMKDEYVNDTKTGEKTRDGPKRMDYKADFRLFIEVEDGERKIWIRKNRYVDSASEGIPSQGSNIGETTGLSELMLLSDVPEQHWRLD